MYGSLSVCPQGPQGKSLQKCLSARIWQEFSRSKRHGRNCLPPVTFNSLSLHTQQECSFSSNRLHKFKEVTTKECCFLRLELIPSLNWELYYFHLTSRQRDRRHLGLLAYKNCEEVNFWKEFSSRRFMKKMLYSFVFILVKVTYFTSAFPSE